MKGKWVNYSAEELAWIEANAVMTRRDLHAALLERFGRSDVTFDHIKALCTRNGWKTGRDGRIQPGSVPANKGKKMPYNANTARTQFKTGQSPRNTKYLGHERMSKNGYVEVSVDEINPHTGYKRRYVLKHKHLWEQKNGQVPEGMCLKCLDGKRENTDPSNWDLIPRAALPFMNGWRGFNYDAAEPEVKPTILTLAKLKVARSRKAKRKTGLAGESQGESERQN